MPKVNVYVPDELLAEVRAADIAVSTVCQEALEAEVRRRNAVAGADEDLLAVAARLVEADAAEQRRAHEDGLAFGIWWARGYATRAELEVVDRAVGRGWMVQYRSVPTMIGALMRRYDEPDVASDDWLDGERSSFDRGVLVGAADVYRAVKPLLEDAQRQARRRDSAKRRPVKKRGAASAAKKSTKERSDG